MCHTFKFLKNHIPSGITYLLGETLEGIITALFSSGRDIYRGRYVYRDGVANWACPDDTMPAVKNFGYSRSILHAPIAPIDVPQI